jgi:hypothetical protein
MTYRFNPLLDDNIQRFGKATEIPFTPYSTLAATNVQGAIQEVVDEVLSQVTETYVYTIAGEVKVASSDTDFIIPFKLRKGANEVVKITQVDYKINSGTGVNIKLTLNGSDMTGFTNISVTSSWGNTNPTDVTLADGDIIGLVVNSVDTTPKNMAVCIHVVRTRV